MSEAKTKVIRTEAGTLELVPGTIDQLRDIARYWPMDLVGYPEGSPDFGLVFQHGEEEVFGVKMQFPDMPEVEAKATDWRNGHALRHCGRKHLRREISIK